MSLLSRHSLGFIALCLAVLLLAQRCYHFADKFGLLRQRQGLSILHPGTCKVLEGDYYGAEDLVALPTGEVLASTGGLNTLKNRFPERYRGDKLLLIDGVTISQLVLKNLPVARDEFVPHGLGVKAESESQFLVFVINHRQEGDYVEMFTWDRNEGDGLVMTHYGSVSSDQLGIRGNLNDVAIVSKHSFYVTNDKWVGSVVGRISHYLGLPVCKFVFWDNGRAVDVSSGYIEPNGVAISPKGDRVFMTDPMSNTFYEFEGDVSKGEVKLVNAVPVNTGCDNIEVISQNEVLLGSHPVLYQLFIYFKDPENLKSPSQIRRLKRKSEKDDWQVSDVFVDDGRLLSGSSVGVYGKENRLYIGSVIDKIVHCQEEDEIINNQ